MITLNANPRTLPEARTEIEKASAEITRLDSELKTAQEKVPNVDVTKLEADLQAMTKRAETAEQKVTDIEPKLEAANSKIADLEKVNGEQKEKIDNFDKTLDVKAKDKAIEILAAKGLSPIKLGLVDSQGEKPDRSALKGVAKVAAAFKEELAPTK